MPSAVEARGVRSALWKAYPWKREFGGTLYAVACSGVAHAGLVALIVLASLDSSPEPVQQAESLDSSLIKVKFVFHEKSEPVEEKVASLPKKTVSEAPPSASVKPLVQKIAKVKKPVDSTPKLKTPQRRAKPKVRRKRANKRLARKIVPKTRQLAAGVSDEGTAPLKAEPPLVVKAESGLPVDTAPEEAVLAENEPTEDAVVAEQESAQPEEKVLDTSALYAAYRASVHGSFQRISTYPRRAERAGLEGRVIVEVVIDGQGIVIARRILRSSGHSILDNAALQSAARISRLPAPPSELKWSQKTLEVPFVYRSRTNAGIRSGRLGS